MSEHKLYNMACGYAEQGIKLLWFKLDKTPGIAWSRDATLDPVKLKEWFYNIEPGQRRIGFKTGQDSRGVVVIDIDVNKRDKTTGSIIDARSVEEKKEYINETYGILPDTLEVYTPSGGRHLYYIADRPVATLKRIFPGDPLDVDSRGDGGVVVAPDEHDYITDGDFHIDNMAPLPEWLYEILARRNPLTRNKSSYTGQIPLIPEMEKAISDAFLYLDYSNRDVWVRTGHAVKTLDSDEAKRLWLEWSQKYADHDPDEAERVWQSFNPSDITIASLFYDAKEKGYEPESISTDILIKEQELKAVTDKPRFEVRTSVDALRPRPPLQWIIQDLMVKGGVCMMTGDAGSGKTWSSLDIAVSIATGDKWLDKETIQGPILIIDEESGDHRLSSRLQKVMSGHNTGEECQLYYVTMSGADLNNALDVYEIEKIIIEKKICFVLIDALMDVILGADENSVKDVIPAFTQLKRISERTGVTFLIIHHNDKSGKGYRGSTAIKGAVDLLMQVEKPENSDKLKITTPKMRDGEPITIKAKMIFTDFSFKIEQQNDNETTGKFTKAECFILNNLLLNGAMTKIDLEKEGEKKNMKRAVHDGIYNLVSKNYIIRTDKLSKIAEYCILENKKIEIESILEHGNLEKYV